MGLFSSLDYIELRELLPDSIYRSRDIHKHYPLQATEVNEGIHLAYLVTSCNQYGPVGKRRFSLEIAKRIRRNETTFEALGLLQAEMGKQQDGKLNFSNHEPPLINKVIDWFEKELHVPANKWHWSIKLNTREPMQSNERTELENELGDYWLKNTMISLDRAYPKNVTYINSSPHTVRRTNDFGTLVIEMRSNILSQIVKILVRTTTHNIVHALSHEIRSFMRGIIAGEGCVEIETRFKHYRVQISGVKDEERRVYQAALGKLNIHSNNYPCSNAVVISRKRNHLQLLKQDLLTLSPEKHTKFIDVLSQYRRF